MRFSIRSALILAVLLGGIALPTTAQDRQAQLADARRLNQQAVQLDQAGRYAEAVPLSQEALAIFEKVLGPGHPVVATVLYNLAELYKAQGDYGRAAPLFQRSLAIREKALGPEHPDVARTLNYLALVYQGQGDY